MEQVKDDKVNAQTKVDSYLDELRLKTCSKLSINNNPSSPQIYEWRRRNNKDKLTIYQIKKELIKNNFCVICKQKNKYQVDHIIPISIIVDKKQISEFQLLCNKCHFIKTQRDIKIINQLKKLGIIKRNGFNVWSSFFSEEERINIYNFILELNIIKEKRESDWYND